MKADWKIILIIILLLGIGTISYLNVINIDSDYRSHIKEYQLFNKNVNELNRIMVNFQRMRGRMRDLFIAKNALDKERHIKRIAELDLLISSDLKIYAQSVKEQERQLALDEVMESYTQFKAVKDRILQLALANREKEAMAIVNRDYYQLIKDLDAKLCYQDKLERNFMQKKANMNTVETENDLNLFFIFLIIGLIPALGFTLVISQNSTNYLNNMEIFKDNCSKIDKQQGAIFHKVQILVRKIEEFLRKNVGKPNLKLALSGQGLESKGKLLLFKESRGHFWELRELVLLVADLADQTGFLINTFFKMNKIDINKKSFYLAEETIFATEKIEILVKQAKIYLQNLDKCAKSLYLFLQEDELQGHFVYKKHCLEDFLPPPYTNSEMTLGLRKLLDLFKELTVCLETVALTVKQIAAGFQKMQDDSEIPIKILEDMSCLAQVQKKLAKQLSLLCYSFQEEISLKRIIPPK